MSNIYVCKYKNYYNRQAKVAGTSSEDYAGYIIDQSSNIDFNPNDGIWSQLVFEFGLADFSEDKIDYLLVCDEDEVIQSRWYIIETTRLRERKYRLKLLRDLVADYKDIIVNAPAFIEKATVGYGNPLLFNSEDMTFNQIKTRETPIWDRTECAWIVGYLASSYAGGTTVSAPLNRTYVAEYASWDEVPLYNRRDAAGKINALVEGSMSLRLRYVGGVGGRLTSYGVDFNRNGYIGNSVWDDVHIPYLRTEGDYFWNPGSAHGEIARQCGLYYSNRYQEFLSAFYAQTGLANPDEVQTLLNSYSEAGTIIKVGNKYYRARRTNAGSVYLLVQAQSTLGNLFTDMVNACTVLRTNTNPPDVYKAYHVNCYQNMWTLSFEEVSAPRETLYVSIPTNQNRNHLFDAPYDMFCIPYQPNGYTRYFLCNHAGGVDQRKINSEAGLAIAQKIVETLTKENVYDLQLLPYCPIPEICYERGVNLYTSSYNAEGVDFSIIEQGTGAGRTAENVVIWCRQSQFSTIMEYDIPVVEPKVEAMCDMYRLVSPNYNGQFQFNHVKNGGVEYFEIECTYKPYSPYIHVAPNFKELYGGDFNDARGLVCGGDFSLPTLTDQWKQFEVNNKNYLTAFNRQIQNLEFNNKYQRQAEKWNIAAGAVGAGAQTGMMVGGATANPVAGVAAGIAGAGISVGAGIADIRINDKLRNEALDFTRDNFGYTLGNIQAMPDVLNNVSAFNINNKVFPILEYYTCTDTEKQALRDKIKYNGMTVMAIGTMNDYIRDEETYIKARIIRLEDLNDDIYEVKVFDYHMASAIAEEIYKGVFI